jgi:NAD(P)-dependent dehydrogenase (short-subunit alcohol dehydrogenase family)
MGARPSVQANGFGFDSNTAAASVTAGIVGDDNILPRTVLITGCTNGIGLETVRGLLAVDDASRLPNHLIMCNRNDAASQRLRAELAETTKMPSNRIHCVSLQLNSLTAVVESASKVRKLLQTFDGDCRNALECLILNAGIFSGAHRVQLSEDGYEKHFAINHLAHMCFTQLLMPSLLSGGLQLRKDVDVAATDAVSSSTRTLKRLTEARIVVVASHSHYFGKFDLSQMPLTPKTYGWFSSKAYEQSKLCNVMFAATLNTMCTQKQWPVTVVSLHPATMTSSNLGHQSYIVGAAMAIAGLFTRSLQQAAATTVYCAYAAELNVQEGSGMGISTGYFDACNAVAPSASAINVEYQTSLWSHSFEMLKRNDIVRASLEASEEELVAVAANQ